MKPHRLLLVLAALLLASALQPFSLSALSQSAAPAADTESPAAKAGRIAWFRDAKFGLFIHWGLYSIPGGYWNGKRYPGIGEWIMNRAQIPVADYSKLASQFNPTQFDADAWAQLAADAGMKYVVITSKHHDGFALFKSAASPYNVVDATPFKRDIIKELSAACARHGLRFGVYYSQAQDWHEPNGAGNTWDFGPDDKKDFDQYLHSKAEPQIRELLTNYGPICLIWFDTPYMMNTKDTAYRGKRFTDIVRTLQPATLIDGRLGTVGDYVSTGDNVIPSNFTDDAWETPATINNTWGYRKDDHDWKRPGEIIFKLVDIVSKGGNYLLNVGPQPDGIIPERSQEILRDVGAWLKVNGEAIYGAQRTPFGDELGGALANQTDRAGKPLWGDRSAWRCTAKPGKLFFFMFPGWPREGFDLPAFQNKIKLAYFLDDPAQTPIEVVTNKDGARTVKLDRIPRQFPANVLVVEYEGDKIEK